MIYSIEGWEICQLINRAWMVGDETCMQIKLINIYIYIYLNLEIITQKYKDKQWWEGESDSVIQITEKVRTTVR